MTVKINAEDSKKLVEEYINNNIAMRTLAKKYGLSDTHVKRILVKHKAVKSSVYLPSDLTDFIADLVESNRSLSSEVTKLRKLVANLQNNVEGYEDQVEGLQQQFNSLQETSIEQAEKKFKMDPRYEER